MTVTESATGSRNWGREGRRGDRERQGEEEGQGEEGQREEGRVICDSDFQSSTLLFIINLQKERLFLSCSMEKMIKLLWTLHRTMMQQSSYYTRFLPQYWYAPKYTNILCSPRTNGKLAPRWSILKHLWNVDCIHSSQNSCNILNCNLSLDQSIQQDGLQFHVQEVSDTGGGERISPVQVCSCLVKEHSNFNSVNGTRPVLQEIVHWLYLYLSFLWELSSHPIIRSLQNTFSRYWPKLCIK